jgi:hypothetical protein
VTSLPVRRDSDLGKALNYHLHTWAVRNLNRAVQFGWIPRGERCEDCGEPHNGGKGPRANLNAHHEDYARPFDVRWLCRLCHAKAHAALAARGIAGQRTADLLPPRPRSRRAAVEARARLALWREHQPPRLRRAAGAA